MKIPRLVSTPLLAAALAGCGDDGTTSASATLGQTSTTLDPTGGPTTGTPTTGTPTGSTTQTSEDTGTASNSAGMTTTTGTTTEGTDPTTTTGALSASSTTAETTGPGTSTTNGTNGDTTTGNDCQPGDTQGMGDVEKSYLWVANSDQGSISKVDTQQLLEVARYRSGPLGGYEENPSRTAVSFDGRFVIVNNRQSGRSTVIAANLEDCVDANGNGMIDTSQNKDDLRAWGQDECVKWSVVHPYNGQIGGGPRAVTWSPGTWNQATCAFEHPVVWVGYLPQQAGTAHMVRLDGATGTVEETVVINNWFLGDTSWGPYGAALDKDLNVWFTGLRGELFRVNTGDNPATFDRWAPGFDQQFYGMTVDPDGDPWFGNNCGDIATFDPISQTFINVAGTYGCHRGLAADKDGSVWVADNNQCGVWQVDHVTNTMVAFHPLNPCSTPIGVSVDDEGFVWVVDEFGGAWKIDPNNVAAMQLVPIAGDHYTYSDMTGGQLKSVVLPQ